MAIPIYLPPALLDRPASGYGGGGGGTSAGGYGGMPSVEIPAGRPWLPPPANPSATPGGMPRANPPGTAPAGVAQPAPAAAIPGSGTGDGGGSGGGEAATGTDWGPTNSRFDQPTPDGGPYNYDRTGHTSATGWSVWTAKIYNAGNLAWSRSWDMPLGVSVYITGVNTFPNSVGDMIVNPIIIYRSAIAPEGSAQELARPDGPSYGMEVHALGISINARPKNPLDNTNPIDTASAAPDGWNPPSDFPAIPAPAPPQVQPLPQVKPQTAPAMPDAQPVTEPATQPAVQPQVTPPPAPSTAPPMPSVGPPNVGTGRDVGASGMSTAVPKVPPRTTPAGTKVVGSVANPVQVDPAQVPETLAGIASEVGRIESKVASLLRRPEPAGFDWQGLLDKIMELLKPDPAPIPGTTYEVRRPCGRGPGGDPLPPVQVPVEEAPDADAAILARLDALAVLIDEQKQLRQPVCKGKPGGEPVTVTFERVG